MFVASSVMEYLSVSTNRILNEILTKSQTKGFDPYQYRPHAYKKDQDVKHGYNNIFTKLQNLKKNAHSKN